MEVVATHVEVVVVLIVMDLVKVHVDMDALVG